jgi:hypothetical protein
MLSVVWIVNCSQGWYERGARRPAMPVLDRRVSATK